MQRLIEKTSFALLLGNKDSEIKKLLSSLLLTSSKVIATVVQWAGHDV